MSEMLRARFIGLSLLLSLLAMPIAARAQESTDAEDAEKLLFKIYDLRETRAALSAALTRIHPATLDSHAETREEPGDPTQRLMAGLCAALGVQFHEVADSIYAVEAVKSQHDRLWELVAEVRGMIRERYEVELAVYAAPSESPVKIGDAAAETKPLWRTRFVAVREELTRVAQVQQHAYVASLAPIAAESAVGYESRVKTVESGMRLMVSVGTNLEEKPSGTALRVRGEIADVKLARSSTTDPKHGNAPIDLPLVDRREIHTDVRLADSKRTVIAVVDHFKPGESLILAASLRKLPD